MRIGIKCAARLFYTKNSFIMKRTIILPLLGWSLLLQAQTTTPTDGDWSKRLVALQNTSEADYMIRLGDVDNLGFGWEEEYNPFSGKSTSTHGFPWDPDAADIKGMDIILLSSSVGKKDSPCLGDGYSTSWGSPQAGAPEVMSLPLASIKGAAVKSAILQLFIDDFQSVSMCSRFQMTINGTRCADGEKLLNAVDQSGPVGKMISIQLSDVFLDMLKTADKLDIRIDDPTTGAQDGYAIDFIKLVVNPKPGMKRAQGAGYVRDAETGEVIANAAVELRGLGTVKTNSDGYFEFNNLLVGLNPVDVFASGYDNGSGVMDVAVDELNPIEIQLQRSSKKLNYNGKTLQAGDAVIINNIQFDQGSFALRSESKTELDKVAAFLKENSTVQIELAGHTSSEGSRDDNRALSLDRVESCKAYLVQKGIDAGRLLTVGHGPDKPLVNNDTEANRAQNRRVEMRILKL